MVDDANRQDVRQPNDGKEANKKLTAESLSDEQLEMIAGAWDDLRNSNTPMADLCEAMSQSKLFDFTSKYNTNNLELRAIASSARETLEARHLAQRNARKQELQHILDAVDSKLTYADKRTALSDLLGFRTIYDMNISDIDHFLADARKELEEIEANESQGSQSADDEQTTAGGNTSSQVNNQNSGQSAGGNITPSVSGPGRRIATRGARPLEHDLTLTFIDQTHDAIAAARDAAESRRRDELQEGGRLKRFLKRIWMGENGVFGAYYLEKYKKEALETISQENDVLAHVSDEDGRRRAQLATIYRFQSEYEESIHTDAGERRTKLDDSSKFSGGVKDLIRRYVEDEITDPEALEEERGRLLQELSDSEGKEAVGEGKVRIDNLLDISEQVKAMVDHGESLDRVLGSMNVYVGESRSNVRSESELSKTERVIERLKRTKVGSLVSPEVIGLSAAVALGMARAGRGTLMRAAGVTLAPGVLGGIFSAFREHARVKQERTIHSREMAQGKRYELGVRREEMEATRYETIEANALSRMLEDLLVVNESDEEGAENAQNAYETIASVEARIQLSDKRNIDLISYSSVTEIELERQRLDVARARAKIMLGSRIDNLSKEYRDQLGITEEMSVDEALEQFTGPVVELNSDIDAKDRAFRSLRRRRVAKAAAVGAATSLAVGVGIQEAAAFADPSYDGILERVVDPETSSTDGRQTLLEGLVNAQPGSIERTEPSAVYESHTIGSSGGQIEIPRGYSVAENTDGTISIEAPDGSRLADGLMLDDQGHLTPSSLEALREKGVVSTDLGQVIEHASTVTKEVSVDEYNQQHAKDLTHVKRDFWYDNSTSPYDKNELGLWWGGTNGNGVGPEGGIQMSVSSMTEGESRYNGHNVSWSESAQEGKIKLAISASRDTQSMVYMVDVNPDGTIDIPADSPAAKFFSVDASGQTEFRGAYAELAEVHETREGVTHIRPLATEVGSNSIKAIATETTETTVEHVPRLKLTPPAVEHLISEKEVEGFGAPGFVPRRSLERTQRTASRLPDYDDSVKERLRRLRESTLRPNSTNHDSDGAGYGNLNYNNPNKRGRWYQERSPRLQQDPDAELETGEELDFYYNQQINSRGKEYIAEIDERIDDNEVLRDMDKNTRAIVVMPVHASEESNNIYKTLSLYSQQDEESKSQSVILMNLNWIDREKDSPEKAAGIQKTLDEIERFKDDHPEVKIAQFTKEWSNDWYENVRHKAMYGEIIKTLYDTAAFSVRRAIKEGRMPKDQEVLMITNDADARGMSKNYLERYIKQMDRSPRSDGFIGRIHWGLEAAEKYPGYYYAQRYQQLANELSTGARGFKTPPATIGPNSAFRVKAYAAIGGCEDQNDMGVGADSVLGYRLWAARNGDEQSTSRHSRRVICPVAGAEIYSAPERLLNQGYREGKFMPDAWRNFNQQVARDGGSSDESTMVPDEDIGRDFESIRERIEQQYTEYINRWYGGDMSLASLTLSVLHPSDRSVEKPKEMWKLRRMSGGRVEFHFTNAGISQLKRSMIRDDKGRNRSLGKQLERKYYGGWTRRSRQQAPLARPKQS